MRVMAQLRPRIQVVLVLTTKRGRDRAEGHHGSSQLTDFQSLDKPFNPSNAALLSSNCVPFNSLSHSLSIVSEAD